MNVGTLSSMFPDLIDNKFVFFCFEAKRNIYEKSGLLLICRKVITQNHSNRYLFLVPQFLSIILIVVKVYLKSYFFIHSFISVNLVYKCSFMTALKSRPAQWHARARWFSAHTHNWMRISELYSKRTHQSCQKFELITQFQNPYQVNIRNTDYTTI